MMKRDISEILNILVAKVLRVSFAGLEIRIELLMHTNTNSVTNEHTVRQIR